MCHVFDQSSSIWPDEPDQYFTNLQITHRQQVGGSCVSTGLSLLTGEEPGTIRQHINTQDPVSWSLYLQDHGMKLAYCPSDFRRLLHYKSQLLALDDLFAISTYSSQNPLEIGAEPDESGWICGSHFFILHRQTVYDTRYAQPSDFASYEDHDRYVKRLFRIVPVDHPRGL